MELPSGSVLQGIVVALSFLLLLRVAIWIYRRHKLFRIFKEHKIPGPEPNFFFGNLHQVIRGDDPIKTRTEWLQTYGKYYGYFYGEYPYLVISDPDMIKEVLVKDFSSFANRVKSIFKAEPLNDSLLYLRDQRWKHVRSIMTPVFTSNKVKRLSTVVDAKVETLVQVVQEHANRGETFDICLLVQALTLDVIAESVLAMRTDCVRNPKDQFVVAVREFFRNANSPAVLAAVTFNGLVFILEFINDYLVSSQMTMMIVENVKRVIHHRRKMQEKGNDILQYLLEASEGEGGGSNPTKRLLTDNELIANLYILLLAGYETTATALSFTFYLLAKHPEVQEKIFEESFATFQEGKEVSYEMIQELKYTDQVVSEAMRMYPPITLFITRECAMDVTLSGGLTVPAGMNVQVPVWEIHHDPELWPDPWRFDPERFSVENRPLIPPMAYLPFGEGPRKCIGPRLAMMEAKLTVAKLVHKFRFEPGDGFEDPLPLVCPTVIINPRNGVKIRAIPR